MLELNNVTKVFDSPDSQNRVPVLKDINLTVERGQSLAIVGPSGSGKSTLLNIIGTLDRPTSGQIALTGRNLSSLNDDQLAAIRNTEIGFVFQLHHLLPQCTVMENILIPTLARKDADSEIFTDKAVTLLERVGLKDYVNYYPGQLSGGQRQRAAVVRAMINDPILLLADEPTGSLDKQASDNIAHLLTELNRDQGVTLIVVTHSVSLAKNMTRLLRLDDGVLTDGADIL